MKRWTNYHGHSKYCDGHGEIEDYVLKAIELNMAAIGISSHAPVPFPTVWTMPEDKLESYLGEIDKLKVKYESQISVLKSLEVDYIPNLCSPHHPLITSSNLDYIIGSVHFVGFFEDGKHWEIDGPAPDFKKGLDEIYGGDIKKVAKLYFQYQNEMLENFTPDILGHMDKIKMHNKEFLLFDESSKWYTDLVKETLSLAKEKEVVVEINTKAFERANHLFPGPEYFSFIRENNIPITINSDAHMTKFLTLGFVEVAELLLNNGITQLHEFIDGEWQGFDFTRQGILIPA